MYSARLSVCVGIYIPRRGFKPVYAHRLHHTSPCTSSFRVPLVFLLGAVKVERQGAPKNAYITHACALAKIMPAHIPSKLTPYREVLASLVAHPCTRPCTVIIALLLPLTERNAAIIQHVTACIVLFVRMRKSVIGQVIIVTNAIEWDAGQRLETVPLTVDNYAIMYSHL